MPTTVPQPAATATATATPTSTRVKIPGEGGIWLLVFADLMVFTTLFAAFLYHRSENEALFATQQAQLSQTAGAINTFLLLTSSLFVVAGVRAFERQRKVGAQWLFGGAMLCGAGFAISKYIEYSDKVDHGLRPSTDVFFQYYYLMTGLHFFHLTIGMGCLIYMILEARKPCTENRLSHVESGATYWHMVDLLWIMLFALLYMVH